PGMVYFEGGVWNMVEKNMPDYFKTAMARNPTGRAATPQDIANATVFLASPASSYTTGVNLGRWRNQPPREFLRQSGNAMAGKARGRKSIFITGAASGMGRETAKLFHGKGWFVGAYDVNTEGLATLAQEIGNDNCHTMRLDVTKKEDFDTAVKAFGEETDGKMDMLHSNAGIGESGWFEDIPFEAAMRVVQINFIGVIASIYAALPLLKNTKNSLVFITSSSSATYGM